MLEPIRIVVTGKSSLSLQDSTPLPREGVLHVSSLKTSSSPGAGRAARSPFVGGATGALAMPPLSFAPAMIVPMTLAVWLIDGVGRSRRARGDALGFAARGVRRRLVVGLRLFRGGPVVARLGLSRRAGQVRVGLASGRPGVAGRAGVLSSARLRAGEAAVAPGGAARPGARGRPRGERMAALRRLHRLPLERNRHGARTRPRARASRLDRRPARADACGGGDIRRAGDAVEPRAGRRADGPRRSWRLSRSPPSSASACFGSTRRRAPRFPASNCASCSPTSRRGRTSRRTTEWRSCAIISPCRIARRRPRPRAWRTPRT